ncbi:MAG: flagellar motor switch protein FliN [Acidimicrobiales bacterium]|nr:flagellar motor switch protein FliN [Acidimicrobiales bacterium]
MSITSSAPAALQAAQARVLPALQRAAAALARSLPADTAIVAGTVDDGAAGRDRLLPGPAARAISAGLDGALRGTVVLAVSSPLAEAIEHGPLLNQELVSGVAQALADAVSVLEPAIGGTLRLEALHELDAAIALGSPGDGAAFVGLTVLDGTAHVATLAVLIREVVIEEDETLEPLSPLHEFEPLVNQAPEPEGNRSLDLLADVEMGVTAELGRTRMTVRELLALTPGSVVELDRTAGSPVDVLVNGTLVARGEVVVIDEEFGVRISEIIGLEATRPRARA